MNDQRDDLKSKAFYEKNDTLKKWQYKAGGSPNRIS